MKTILATLAGGLLIGAFAASHAELPPPTPEEKAAAAAKAKKDAVEKAKDAQEVAQAQDKAVANYRKSNKGKGSSPAGATAQPAPQENPGNAQAPAESQGADHANAGRPDSELTPHEAQTEMPKPGQANDYSTPARDPQNSSSSR
jgi:hypothetical protein